MINKKFKGLVEFKKADIREVTPDMFGVENFDVVVSDMAAEDQRDQTGRSGAFSGVM